MYKSYWQINHNITPLCIHHVAYIYATNKKRFVSTTKLRNSFVKDQLYYIIGLWLCIPK